MKVLVVEDDPRVSQALQYLLSNYHYAVDIAIDGEAGWHMAEDFGYDLIVLDVLLPKLDGISLCKQLRAKGCQIPILLLTGQDGGHQKAMSLNAGADDYVVKPFNAEELIARVQALLRRGDLTTQPILSWGHLSVDPIAQRVTYGTHLLTVTPKEFAILELFLRNPQMVFNARAILARVWDSIDSPGEEAVRVHIKELRKKLKQVGAPQDFIETVYRMGYHLNPIYSAALAIPDETTLTPPQIAELKAANGKLRATLDQMQATQAQLRQENQALVTAQQALEQERQQLELARAELEAQLGGQRAELAAAHQQGQLWERQWQGLFDHSLDAIVIADDQGGYVDANPAACDLLGVTKAQLCHQSLFDFVLSGQDFALVWQAFLRQGQLSVKASLARADRAIRETTLRAIANVIPRHHLLIFREISDHQPHNTEPLDAQTSLQKREEHLRLALYLGGIGSWDWWVESGMVTWNEAHYRLLGYQPQAAAPNYQLWRSHIHPDDIERVEQSLFQALENQIDFEAEYRMVLRNGSCRWVISRGRGLYDELGQPIRMVGVIFDVTDRKQLEINLRQREAHQRALIEAIPDLIERMNGDGIYLDFIAHSDFPVIGNRAEMVGSHISAQLPPKTAQQRLAYIRQALQTQAVQIYEQDLSMAGKTHIEEVRVVPYADNEVLLLIRDITDRKQGEVQLHETAQRLALATSAAQIGIWEHDFRTDQLIWDDCICGLYGIDPAEFDGCYDTWRRRMHPEDLPMAEALVQAILDGERDSFACEIRAILPNGQLRFIEAHGMVVRDADNVAQRLIGANRDISDRKQAEAQLNELTQRLALATSSAKIGVWDMDWVNNCLLFDAQMHRLYGLETGEFKGRYETWQSQVHPDDLPAVELEVQAALTGERDYHTEFRIIWPDGQIRYMEAHGMVMRDLEGVPQRSIGVNWDITHRKLAEQKIQEQAALLDIASDAIIVRDLNQQILYWNQGAERLYGWRAVDAIGQKADLLFRHDTAQSAAIIAQLLDQGEWQGELRKSTQGGESVTVASRWTLAQNEAQNAVQHPQLILSVDTDITDQKRLEAQFYQAQRLDSLGRLASGIAHDLNNVFTPILTMVQLLSLLQPDLKTDPAQEQLRLIEESAKQGTGMVQQILTFAQGSSEERTVVDLAALLADIAIITRQSFPKSIEIHQNWPESDQSLQAVNANQAQLHQVFMNLCINARDAMADGGVLTLSVENRFVDAALARQNAGVEGGDYVVVTVADTGVGISPDVRDRIFDPFFTTKPVGQGTGLGLATVLGIVNSYKGFLQVFSEPGQGTQVKVYLPATEKSPITRSLLSGRFNGNGERVLVVDDDVAVQLSTQAVLESHHYTTLIARDGIEATEIYAQYEGDISLVILDVMMPNMGGIPLVRSLKTLAPTAKIIAISGVETNREPVLAAGAKAFLAKPYPLADLLAMVQALIHG